MMKNYPWENLDTTTLILLDELYVYYLYKYELDIKPLRKSALNRDAKMIEYYKKKKEEEFKCTKVI